MVLRAVQFDRKFTILKFPSDRNFITVFIAFFFYPIILNFFIFLALAQYLILLSQQLEIGRVVFELVSEFVLTIIFH